VDVSKFLALKSNAKIKAKCPCGHSYQVVLERRKHYRKATKLAGAYSANNDKQEWPITITNLSRSGLGFTATYVKNLKTGDQVDVVFRLDDKNKSLIRKNVTIRKINGKQINAEFSFPDKHDKILGFYLFN
jgi:CRISPR/Cas system CMR-associated protein Cmr1 (group 7 of RAMP superfamily)